MNEALRAAMAQCDPDVELQPSDPRWVDFASLRGDTHKRLLEKLQSSRAANKFAHIAYLGHRGCGKSTELNTLVRDAKARGFLPLKATVTDAFDENEFSFGDVLRLIAELLDKEFGDRLPAATIKLVEDWFKEVTHVDATEIERTWKLGADAELGVAPTIEAEINVGVGKGKVSSPLGKILGVLGLLRKSTDTRREEIRENVERHPKALLDQINFLLDDAQKLVKDVYPGGLVFVLDNVDRYTPEMIDAAFIKMASLFRSLNAHLIFTVHISHLYNPTGEVISDRYEWVTLPMIPVQLRETHQPNKPVVARVIEAINKRVPLTLFAQEDLPAQAVQWSGGCPRDLFKLLQLALELSEADNKISASSLQQAADELAQIAARRLSRAQFDTLAQVHQTGDIEPSQETREMLYRRDILEYNGQGWYDAHPLLIRQRRFQEAVARADASKTQK